MHWQVEEMKQAKNDGVFVRIDRATKWGNPFSHLPGKGECQVATREDAIECYRLWVPTQPDLLEDLPELEGKVLGCWCAPRPCHGDVLIELIELLTSNDIR
jgi:hypothetical protein